MHECLVQVSGSGFQEAKRVVKLQERVIQEGEDESQEAESTVGKACQMPRDPRPPNEITADTVWLSMSKTFGTGVQVGKMGITFTDPDTTSYVKMEEKDVVCAAPRR